MLNSILYRVVIDTFICKSHEINKIVLNRAREYRGILYNLQWTEPVY